MSAGHNKVSTWPQQSVNRPQQSVVTATKKRQHGHNKASTKPQQSVITATTKCHHGHNKVSSRPQQSVIRGTTKCQHGHNKASTRPQPSVITATTKRHHGHRVTQSNNLDDIETTDYIHCEANVDNSAQTIACVIYFIRYKFKTSAARRSVCMLRSTLNSLSTDDQFSANNYNLEIEHRCYQHLAHH